MPGLFADFECAQSQVLRLLWCCPYLTGASIFQEMDVLCQLSDHAQLRKKCWSSIVVEAVSTETC